MEDTSAAPTHWAQELDLEPVKNQNGPAEAATAQKGVRQPWREYWPLTCGSRLYEKFQIEFPDILSWRFDSTRPFERPWRFWRDRIAPGKEGDLYKGAEESKEEPLLRQRAASESAIQADSRRNLDEQLKKLNMIAVESVPFYYLAPLDLYRVQKPYRHQMPNIDGLKRSNVVTQCHPVTVYEVSGNEHVFTLEKSGFEFAKCPVSMEDWTESSVIEQYIPRLEDWLKGYLGCEQVSVYTYRFRKKNHNAEKCDWGGPLFRVHCDSTEQSCNAKAKLYLPDTPESLMKGRIRCLNVWRPITTPVQDCPLAMCDARTVNKEDLVSMDIVYPHYSDEAYEVMYSPTHRWFYKKGMQSDDIIIFKLGDNSETEATVCPHSAFMDPSLPSGAPSRVSIEIKAIVFG
ncbi:hypothetical protein AJ79_05281 [Helicocarpus griseus UAMH5409]|uniref:Uncharacterized protein n=1 Tax=Helicocarpus griseus UAMH5409 TaxID=1447875 RepID=A0A2B7XQC9_9EURO|nr:hypothetical protein AJ79_10055 [Helicocarpus griseus UAMH5409]PGH10808.1 hypothetical protein AJ79_05281 [Helicocarpus griseus UAMH5409]